MTGASRGIGAEVARAMARAGAAVVLAARDEEALASVAAEIEKEGGRAVVALALRQIGDHDEARRLARNELELARSWGAPRALGAALREMLVELMAFPMNVNVSSDTAARGAFIGSSSQQSSVG